MLNKHRWFSQQLPTVGSAALRRAVAVCDVCQSARLLAGPGRARVAHVQLGMRQVMCALAAEEQRICCKRADGVAGLVQQDCGCILLCQAALQILGVCSTCLLRARCHLRQHLSEQIAWSSFPSKL